MPQSNRTKTNAVIEAAKFIIDLIAEATIEKNEPMNPVMSGAWKPCVFAGEVPGKGVVNGLTNGLTAAGFGVAGCGGALKRPLSCPASPFFPLSVSNGVFGVMIRCAAIAFSASGVTGPRLLPLVSV